MGLTGRFWRNVQAANDELVQALNEFAQHEGHRFRVTAFGSARFKESHPSYMSARSFAKRIAENDIDIVTGGGPGIMEAANRGAHEANSNARSIGTALTLPMESGVNNFVGHPFVTENFPLRLQVFGALAPAHVCFDGGIGTALELFYFLQHSQIQRQMGMHGVHRQLFPMHPSVDLGYIPKIVVVNGGFDYVDKALEEFENRGTAPSNELDFIYKAQDKDDAFDFLIRERENWRTFLKEKGVEPLN